jgi:hypothetical protein
LPVFGALFRIYSYLYHLILALLLLGIAVVAILSHSKLNLAMLPWTGDALIRWLLIAALVGLLSIVLAWMSKLRFLFLLYSLAVLIMMVRGYFLGGYAFSGKDEFRMAVYLTVGALVAIIGAWSQFRKPSKSKRR